MLSFESDYIEGAHPKILEALTKTNMESLSGYGADSYTKSAKEKIAAACALPDAQVAFLTGGTQTNQIVIDTMLHQYEGVISAQSGHVNVHEAGAIEFTGRKVLTLPSHNGKIDAAELDSYVSDFYNDGNHEHMVFPGIVYISHPTEYGTLYSKSKMTEISKVCRKHE
ncbi:MAG: low specificity L-threonine aldolase, partial [Treponema sp.]|nr:low specificity L-threonine aldolase [Treponema sp.]